MLDNLLSDGVRMASLPAWGVWIEMSKEGVITITAEVAPRMGSVD